MSIHEDEAVVLVIRAAVFVVFQFEVAFLKLHLIRWERTIVRHFVNDGIDDTAFANEMPLAGKLFPAEAHTKHHQGRLFLLHMPDFHVRNHSAYCTRASGAGQ